MRRNLDGVYFRIKDQNGYDNVCFSDLTSEQQDEVMKGKNEEWLRSLCKILAQSLKEIGDQFDIVCGHGE